MSLERANMARVRGLAKRVPGLKRMYRQLRQRGADGREALDVLRLRAAAARRGAFEGDPSSNVVVSLTSFPARIQHAWIPIETIFQQNRLPAKVVLVLSEQEFPGRRLPRQIRHQEERGLEILWVKRNTRSYKKLLPTRAAYPDARIVTIDDDLLYAPWALAELIAAADENPGAIVGHRGWEIDGQPGRLEPYVNWARAGRSTPSERVFLTSGAGVLFPPGILCDDYLFDIDLAEELCPNADDIWFWAVARLSGTPLICLGNHELRPLRRLKETANLQKINREGGENDVKLEKTINRLWLASRI